MCPDFGVTKEGFKRKDYEMIKDSILDRAKDLFPDDTDFSDTSPLMAIIRSISFEIARGWDVAEHNYASGFIDQASGKSLENICAIAGIYRNEATPSEGLITVEGDGGITIEEGFTVETDDGLKFETTEEGTIDSSESIELEIECLKRGKNTNVGANTITNFVDHKSGLYSVTNESETYGGTDIEDDKSLRTRMKNSLLARGNATKIALKQSLLDVDGVTTVLVRENSDEVKLDITVGGLGEFKGQPVEDDLIEVIDETRAFGIYYDLFEPTEIEIQVGGNSDTVKIKVEEEYPYDAENQIRTSIHQHINTLNIGEDVLYAKLYDIIYNTGEWIYNIENLQLKKLSGSTLSTNDISISKTNSETPVIIDSNVTSSDNETVEHDAGSGNTWDSTDIISFPTEYSGRVINIPYIKDGNGDKIDESLYDVDYTTEEIDILNETNERYLYVTYELSDVHIELQVRS